MGILFKLGAAPFHFWLSDVYEGSPMIITYFFSVLPKISILCILIRVFSFSFCFDQSFIFDGLFSDFFVNLIIYCSLLSILVGSIGALYQVTIKRLLAYSAIANMGIHIIKFGC